MWFKYVTTHLAKLGSITNDRMGRFQWVGGKLLKESTSEEKNAHLPHLWFGKGLLRPLIFLAPWRAQSAPADMVLNSGKW